MEQQSIIQNNLIGSQDPEFHDAVEEFPFIDASNSFKNSDQSDSNSDPDSNNEDESTVSVISEHTPDSPSSPSSAGLRHRRPVSPQTCNDFSQSQFFKNNPDGLIDFDPQSTTVSTDNKYKRSWSLKDNEKLDKLISTGVNRSSGSDSSSAITTVNRDDESSAVDSPNSVPNLLFILAELIIKVIGFQSKFVASSVTFPIWLIHTLYLLVTDPYAIIKLGRNYVLGNVSGVWGIGYTVLKFINRVLNGKNESAWKLCFRIGKILLWIVYCGIVLVGLLVPAFLVSGMMVEMIVDEPVQITEQLTFDYTKDTPMAFVPIISCQQSSSLEQNEKRKITSFTKSRVVPVNHELQAMVSLTLPESDYNRNLGIFQVRVDYLSGDGKLLASTRQPCMLQFKSPPVRLLSTFFKFAALLTGYSSETQTLDIKFNGYTEKYVPTYCTRVVIEQRAEFARGGGVPEIYTASLKLESQLPFLKRMLWYWKWLIYMWMTFTMFITELLFTILCCTPIIFPGVRRMGSSLNNNASRNTARG